MSENNFVLCNLLISKKKAAAREFGLKLKIVSNKVRWFLKNNDNFRMNLLPRLSH